jgi:CAP-Gly domain-containing linker protein 3/4
MNIQIGSKVLIEGNRTGIVRYYGNVLGKSGNWVGVELDFALGRNDGTFEGYFVN